jgi:hypothetical protein
MESERAEEQPKALDTKALALKWLKEIDRVQRSKEQKAFENIGERIVKKYRNADALQVYSSNVGNSTRVMLNALWTVVEIMKPVLYARMPQIVVEREFKDKDDVARVAAMGAERCVGYMLRSQQNQFNYAVKGAVLDRLLSGRGQVWPRFEYKEEEPYSEKVCISPLNWLDYLESPARNQYEIRWRAKRAHMSRQALINRFGEKIGNAVKFETEDKRGKDADDIEHQAEVWEIWDKDTKRVYWVSKGYKDDLLDWKDDPLRLKEFFPCPIPLLATTVTDTTYPTPDFKIYEKLADEVDYITKRIASIVDCIRVVGVTAASLNADLKNMLKLNDGDLWPIEQWVTFSERGGLRGAVDWFPFEQAANVLPTLIQYQQHCISLIFEQIVGLPDIVRGFSDPNETAAAQQKKSHWTVVRVAEKQQDVQRFCRDIVGITAEIMFEPGLFSDETLSLMAGAEQFSPEDQALWPEALAMLRNDRLRTFRVDIETDSTIAADQELDKQSRTEFIGAITQLFGQVQSVVQFSPELMKPMLESALFAARAFKAGRALEGAFEQAIDRIVEQQKQPPPPPPPDYEMQKLQLESQGLQLKAQEAQGKAQLEMQKLQLEAEDKRAKIDIEMQKMQLEMRRIMSDEQRDSFDARLEEFKEQFNQWAESQRLQLQQMTESQRLELEKAATILQEREKLIEEARLKQEQMLRSAELLAAKQPAQQAAPNITIVNDDGEKEVLLSRDAMGGLVGRTRRVKRDV